MPSPRPWVAVKNQFYIRNVSPHLGCVSPSGLCPHTADVILPDAVILLNSPTLSSYDFELYTHLLAERNRRIACKDLCSSHGSRCPTIFACADGAWDRLVQYLQTSSYRGDSSSLLCESAYVGSLLPDICCGDMDSCVFFSQLKGKGQLATGTSKIAEPMVPGSKSCRVWERDVHLRRLARVVGPGDSDTQSVTQQHECFSEFGKGFVRRVVAGRDGRDLMIEEGKSGHSILRCEIFDDQDSTDFDKCINAVLALRTEVELGLGDADEEALAEIQRNQLDDATASFHYDDLAPSVNILALGARGGRMDHEMACVNTVFSTLHGSLQQQQPKLIASTCGVFGSETRSRTNQCGIGGRGEMNPVVIVTIHDEYNTMFPLVPNHTTVYRRNAEHEGRVCGVIPFCSARSPHSHFSSSECVGTDAEINDELTGKNTLLKTTGLKWDLDSELPSLGFGGLLSTSNMIAHPQGVVVFEFMNQGISRKQQHTDSTDANVVSRVLEQPDEFKNVLFTVEHK